MNTEVKQLVVEQWLVARLIPYARNARTHSEAQIAQIAASIAEFGFNNPVLADPAGGIIAGHGRILAARKLGLKEVPVIVLGHLTANQKRAFMLADNQLALTAVWDLEMLSLELEALGEQDFDLKLTGFDQRELNDLLARADKSLTDGDEVPSPQKHAVSTPGDLWLLGEHRLLCGDGTQKEDVLRVLDGPSCDLVFTDLPYNVDYCGKNRSKMKLVNDNLGAGFGAFLLAACQAMLEVSEGPVYICMSSSELHHLHAAFLEAGGHWSTYIIWGKNTFTLGRSDYQRQYEPMLYGWPEGKKHFWCGSRNQGDLWLVNKPHKNDLHPTMKPVELVERAIHNSSERGAMVLDPFAGSGTTLIACEKPGTYTVKLTKGEKVYASQINVVLDPRAAFTVEDRKAQFDLVTRMSEMLNHMSWAVDAIVAVRDGATERAAKLPEGDSLRARLGQLAQSCDAIRSKIVATKEGGMITGEMRLREHIAGSSDSGGLYGDVMSYEGRPTNSQGARADALGRELDDVVREFTELATRQLPDINRDLQGKNAPLIKVVSEMDWRQEHE